MILYIGWQKLEVLQIHHMKEESLELNFPENYPYEPPKLNSQQKYTTLTLIKKGRSHQISQLKIWCLYLHHKCFAQYLIILADPISSDSLVPEIYYIYKTDLQRFKQIAKKYTQKYAK